MNIVGVIVNRATQNVDRVFHYLATDEIYSKLKIGSLVLIPFGRGNAITEGYVLEFPEKTDLKNLKEIVGIIDSEPQFTDEQLEIAKYMQEHYFCSLISALKLLVSPGSKISKTEVNDKVIRGASLKLDIDEAFFILEKMRTKAPKQAKIIELMLQNDFVSFKDIKMLVGCGDSAIKSLIDKGVLEESEITVFRNPVNFDKIKPDTPKKATVEQKKAIDSIVSCQSFKTFLLHGVTGSGKTEVFLQSIQNVIENGKSALVLVPEISLTPQMVSRFAARFGKRIAILHSRLSYGERSDEYKRIKTGEADVVIGVRSAVFAPFKNLGLIIIDEEHENTYKSEKVPCYHAREIAEFRAKNADIPLVLASATPAIESYHKAKTGEYELLTLKSRINGENLPEVSIVDMRKELEDGNRSVFSKELIENIKLNKQNGEQSILFLNRRGFSTFVSCRSCGFVAKCIHCNISLTYHKDRDYLNCHYCGYTIKNYKTCPECGSPYIKHFGTGTQKIEEEAKEIFPENSFIRMDVDTTGRKSSHEKILKTFEEENIDVLIGTQMITKGLDFPNVTLVGVIAADMSLNLDDFKANERTFSQITQVTGRAGRGEKKGRAIIQTYMPENNILHLAAKQDYEAFFDEEIMLRKTLNFPPFCDIVSFLFTSQNQNYAFEYAKSIEKELKKEFAKFDDDCVVLSTTPALISKINNKYRFRITLKLHLDNAKRDILRKIINNHYSNNKIKKIIAVSIEINPTALF